MDSLEIKSLCIKPDVNRILHAIGCPRESTTRSVAVHYFNEIVPEFINAVKLYSKALYDTGFIYCALSLGEDVSRLISGYFDSGDAMKGLIADSMADDYLFEADAALMLEVKKLCAKHNIGIKKRLCAPDDFPLTKQPSLLEKLGADCMTLTDAFMLSPIKSMLYILEITDDTSVYNAQHDCLKCSAKDCPRRKTDFVDEYEILAEYAYKPRINADICAVCIDIGTTTLAFEYISGSARFSYKALNPQRRFGYDVLSRIDAANRGRLSELKNDIVYALKTGISVVTSEKKRPDKIIIAGNTAMIHLLLGTSCVTLGKYPFESNCLEPLSVTLDQILPVSERIPVTIMGGISAFAGGDIVSGLYMCGFHETEKINLFIDLGTNCEMAIGNKYKILVTSAAAGPAFEGGMISCGMGSVDGAIYGVCIEPYVIHTIGNKEPAGICGSGIVELVSEMLDRHIIDKSGLFTEKYFENGFPITDKIIFTQRDIRHVQTAKAAIRAGVECLLREYGSGYDNIDNVFLAGGFGRAIDTRKACNIGILPRTLAAKTKSVGNSSLGGCVRFFAENGIKETELIRTAACDFSLAEIEHFNELYIKYMNF